MPKYEPGHFNQQKYVNDFMKENYDRIIVQVPKGNRETLRQLSKLKRMSQNQLIIEAIENYYHIDISTKPD